MLLLTYCHDDVYDSLGLIGTNAFDDSDHVSYVDAIVFLPLERLGLRPIATFAVL